MGQVLAVGCTSAERQFAAGVNSWNGPEGPLPNPPFPLVAPQCPVQAGVTADAPWMTAGDIAKMVGRGSNDTTALWQLEHVRFHWGRTNEDGEGSEHYLHGRAFPLEAQFVHFNRARGSSIAEAARSPDGLLVKSVFFDLNATNAEPQALTDIAAAVQNVSRLRNRYVDMNVTVQLHTFFTYDDGYYAYAGSLTTPTCDEVS